MVKKNSSSGVGVNELAKLYMQVNAQRGKEGPKKKSGNKRHLHEMSRSIQLESNETSSIRSIISEIELIEQILIPLIKSPNDMANAGLMFTAEGVDEVPAAALDVVREYFTNTYKISNLIEPICKACLFDEGSYPIAIFPESAITSTIRAGFKGNVSDKNVKSVKDKLKSLDLESFDFAIANDKNRNGFKIGEHVSITGKSYKIYEGVRNDMLRRMDLEARFNDLVSPLDLEARKDRRSKVSVTERDMSVFFAAQGEYETIGEMNLKTPKQNGDNDDLGYMSGFANVFRLPPSSIIPIVSPNDNERSMGYYLIMDSNYHPVKTESAVDAYGKLKSRREALTAETLESVLGEAGRSRVEDFRKKDYTGEMAKMYEDCVVSELKRFLADGIGDSELDVRTTADITLTLLWRSMERRKTNIVYIPPELISYFAFRRNQHGIGKTVLEDHKVTVMQYALVLIANSMAAVRNSTSRQTVNIQLPENDPNKERTVEEVLHEVAKSRALNEYPMTLDYGQMVEGLMRSNTNIKTSTEGDDYPDMDVTVEERQGLGQAIDSQYETRAKNRFISIWGIQPNIVDVSQPVEFSRSIAQSDMITAKKVTGFQEVLEPQITEHARRILRYSPSLRDKLTEAGIKDTEAMREFINSLQIRLPRANVTRYKAQQALLGEYRTLISEAVDLVLPRDMFSRDVLKDEADLKWEALKAGVVGYYTRKFMANNGILPELTSDLYDEDSTLADSLAEDFEYLQVSALEIQNKLDKVSAKLQKKLTEKENSNSEATEESSRTDGGYSEEGDVQDDVSQNDESSDDSDELGIPSSDFDI